MWHYAERRGLNMEEIKWQSLKIEIEEYLEAADDIEDGLSQVLRLNLQIGQNKPSERENVKNAMRSLLKGRDGTPFGKGKRSGVPAIVRVAIDRVCNRVGEASMLYFNHHPYIAMVTLGRGKKSYDSAEEYAKAQVKAARARLAKMYKDKLWDGTLESLHEEEE
tara:strand:+ start:312 stop:803 length:492 start_codon:yes stop_codon:yes gene_type:complete